MSRQFDAISIDNNEYDLSEARRIAEMEKDWQWWEFKNCGELQEVVAGRIIMQSENVHEFYWNVSSNNGRRI